MYWSYSWDRILNVQDIIKERTKETSSNISSTCIPFTIIAGAGQHSFNTTYDVPRTEDVGLPTKFRFNVGPASQPIAGSMPSIVYDTSPTLIHHWVCCILCANTWHSPNAVSMLTNSPLRWPFIETTLGDCTVFPACCIMRVTLFIPAPETPDHMMHWPNADVMLGHPLRRWANIIPTKTLWAVNHNYIFFSEHLLKTKVLNLRTWNVILHMFIRTGVRFSHTIGHKLRLNKLKRLEPTAEPKYEEDTEL